MKETEMIKILFFIETLEGGGAEKVLRNLVNNMDQTKFDITVQTVWPCTAKKYLAEGIRYKSMYSARNSANETRCRIEAETGLAYRLHIKDNYDIECAYLEAGTTKIMAASTNKKARKLAWVHCDLKKAISDTAAFVKKTRPYYAKFDKVICVSENVKDSFVELFGDTVPAEVIYNTIDDAEIRSKAELPLPENVEKRRTTVLAVGTMYGPKNFIRLLKTHKQLLSEEIEHDLWIIGEGPDREKLEAFVEENGISDSVFMPGFQQNPYPFIREADLLVCSSNYEGFSTFITEGMILGRAVVTTECSGMREILGDSEYGLITENDDGAFLCGVREMLTNEALRYEYSGKAAERGRMFSTESLAEKTEEFLIRELDANAES